mmetsp:Transcript_21468/g.55262  ORF Transcript_21468/g.55262 Transcript_21468/m.55262 type:complete len:398 (-) Transcript_21468:512-1705(-)
MSMKIWGEKTAGSALESPRRRKTLSAHAIWRSFEKRASCPYCKRAAQRGRARGFRGDAKSEAWSTHRAEHVERSARCTGVPQPSRPTQPRGLVVCGTGRAPARCAHTWNGYPSLTSRVRAAPSRARSRPYCSSGVRSEGRAAPSPKRTPLASSFSSSTPTSCNPELTPCPRSGGNACSASPARTAPAASQPPGTSAASVQCCGAGKWPPALRVKRSSSSSPTSSNGTCGNVFTRYSRICPAERRSHSGCSCLVMKLAVRPSASVRSGRRPHLSGRGEAGVERTEYEISGTAVSRVVRESANPGGRLSTLYRRPADAHLRRFVEKRRPPPASWARRGRTAELRPSVPSTSCAESSWLPAPLPAPSASVSASCDRAMRTRHAPPSDAGACSSSSRPASS